MRSVLKKNLFLAFFLSLFGVQFSLRAFPLGRAVQRANELGQTISAQAKEVKSRLSRDVKKNIDDFHDAIGDEIKAFASRQWESDYSHRYLRTYENMTNTEKPQFIVFFAHGYRPFLPSYEYAKGRFARHIAPFLRSFKYVAYHPLLKVGPKYTAFAQGSDVEQVKYHLDRVLAMTKNPESPFFNLPIIVAGHSNGAATMVSVLGCYPGLSQNVSGVLLFAPYVDIRKTNMLQKIAHRGVGSKVIDAAPFAIGMRYDVTKKAPIQYVLENSFPRLPVFLIHCKNDSVIPFSQNFVAFQEAFSQPRYKDLFQGFPFEVGNHGGFSLKSTKEDRGALKKALHQFCAQRILAAPTPGVTIFEELSPAILDD